MKTIIPHKIIALKSLSQRQWIIVGLAAAMLIFYGILKSNPSTIQSRVIKSEGFDYSSSRVLGKPVDHMLNGKSQKIFEKEKQLVESNKLLLKKIEDLEARFTQIDSGPKIPVHSTKTDASLEKPLSNEDSPAVEVSNITKTENQEDTPIEWNQTGAGFQSSRLPATKDSGQRIIRRPDHDPQRGEKKSERAGHQLIHFPVKHERVQLSKEPGLPPGAFVKGVVLTGVDAHQAEWPVLIQLEEAFVGPNETRIDLSGCFVIAKAKGDLSIERAIMQTEKISCVAENGDLFESLMNGWVNDDEDNRFGVKGPVMSKRGRVLTTAFLASVVEGIGRAIQLGESTQMTNAVGGAQSVITGDQGRFIAGGAAAGAASRVADWYLRQAENLLPSITVGSGKSVWIAVKDKVNLPARYFESEIQRQIGGPRGEKPYLSYLN